MPEIYHLSAQVAKTSRGKLASKLAQHINTWLTGVNASGALFETDLRLRSNDAQYARVEHWPLAPYIEATLELWKAVFDSDANSSDGAQC